MKSINVGNGVVIKYSLLIAADRKNSNGNDTKYWHLEKWRPEGNPEYKTQEVKNSVTVQGWNENIQVKDLIKNFSLRHAYVTEPGSLGFAWQYRILVEATDPKTEEKTGYVFFYKNENGTLISMVETVKPDKGRSLQAKLIELGFIRATENNHYSNGRNNRHQPTCA